VISNADDQNLFIDVPSPRRCLLGIVRDDRGLPVARSDPYGTDGQYYFVLGTDVTDALIESDERTTSLGRIPSASICRISSWKRDGPGQIDLGSRLQVTIEVRNTGTAEARIHPPSLAVGRSRGALTTICSSMAVPALAVYSWPDYAACDGSPVYLARLDPFGTDLRYYVLAEAT
jgi:hypothetical protein